ncbi:MAG: hypothetical protein JWM86_691 [Thermoleophilia bacterium]|nr:hypothetical protein [Thermoleophilia bacterium]
MDETPRTPTSYVPPVVDESRDWDIGPVDIVLGVLTFPLLMWVLQYAFTGSERIVATRASRLRLYLVLLVVEALLVAALVLWITR